MPTLFPGSPLKNRGLFIGMDEAGYGPNLGPLLIAATVWDTPSLPDQCDFPMLLSSVVDCHSTCKGTKLHITDSKLVNVGKHGFTSLETSALALLNASGTNIASYQQIVHELCPGVPAAAAEFSAIPWFQEDLHLPVSASPETVSMMSERLQNACRMNNVQCRTIQAQVVPTPQFNSLLNEHGSKGVLLTTLACELLARVWNPSNPQQTLFIGDKHGGRNRYDEFLAQVLDGEMIFRLEEGQQLSRYRVNTTELRFQAKGEQHLPVAAASIVAKYLRELAMLQFNRFWIGHIPDLRPTKGYPVDAKRFHQSIQAMQAKLGLGDTFIWRAR